MSRVAPESDKVHLLSHSESRLDQPSARKLAEYNSPTTPKRVTFDPYNHSYYPLGHNDGSHRLDVWTTVLMTSLLVLGVGCGIAHHVFNAYLDSKPTSSFDQAWAIRIGTALALALKTAILASMGMAFAQRMWLSVRHRTTSVKSLDSLFGAFGGDPRSVFRGELYKSAGLALGLAVLGWLLPIATVFTPATLRVKPVDRLLSSQCIVPNVDLGNNTDGGAIRFPSANGLYAGPSPMVRRLAVQSLITGSPVPFLDISNLSVPTNASYMLSFTAPALRCSTDTPTNLSNNTYWTSSRSTMHDSNSGQDIPTLRIQYVSPPSSPNAVACIPYLADYGMLIRSNSSITMLNLTMTKLAGRPTGGSAIQLSPNNALLTGSAALVDAVFDALVGEVSESDTTSTIGLASFIHLNSSRYTFDMSVTSRLEQLMQNTVAGLFSLNVAQTTTTCAAVSQVNVYEYDQGVLIGSYLAAVFVGMTAVGIGLHALKQNGHAGDTSFSGVLLATRNPTLDRVCEDGRDRLLGLGVKLGRLNLNGRMAFGTVSDLAR